MDNSLIWLDDFFFFFSADLNKNVKVVQAAGQNQLTFSSYLFQRSKPKKNQQNPQDLNAAFFFQLTINTYLYQSLPHFKILLDKINFYTYIFLCWKYTGIFC